MNGRDEPRGEGRGPSAAARGSIVSVVASLWLTTVILSLLGAADVSAWILHDPALSAHPLASAFANGLVRASEVTRAGRAYEAIDSFVTNAKPEVVWLREANHDEPPPLDDGAEAPTSPGDDGASAASAQAEGAPPRLSDSVKIRRVLLIGESSMQLELGLELERHLRASYEGLTLKRFGKLSTSLVRPDYFDWPQKTKELLEEFRPDLVIANYGGNDAQNIAMGAGKTLMRFTPEWDEEFGRRVTELTELIESHGATLVLIGMPIMRSAEFTKSIRHVNAVMERSVEAAGGVYISQWDFSGDENGAYRQDVTVDGASGLMRWPDGIHYTRLGARFATRWIMPRIERHFLFLPVDAEAALVFRHTFEAKAGRKTSYVAYVPRSAASGQARAPMVLVLAANGSFEPTLEASHRELQLAAARAGTILVVVDGADDALAGDVAAHAKANFFTTGDHRVTELAEAKVLAAAP